MAQAKLPFAEIEIKLLFKALFDPKVKFIEFQGKRIRKRKIKIKYANKFLSYFPLGRFIFIEQNPFKKSKWAAKARAGKKIAWLIDTKTEAYLCVVTKEGIKKGVYIINYLPNHD